MSVSTKNVKVDFECVSRKNSVKVSPVAAAFGCIVVGVLLNLGVAGCVSSSDDDSSAQEIHGRSSRVPGHSAADKEELTDVTEDQLYGDLEAGLDSPLWTDEEQSSKNVIDKALSQSPYQDFDEASQNNAASSSDWVASPKQGAAAKETRAKKTKKLGEMSKKSKGSRELKSATKKEKSR